MNFRPKTQTGAEEMKKLLVIDLVEEGKKDKKPIEGNIRLWDAECDQIDGFNSALDLEISEDKLREQGYVKSEQTLGQMIADPKQKKIFDITMKAFGYIKKSEVRLDVEKLEAFLLTWSMCRIGDCKSMDMHSHDIRKVLAEAICEAKDVVVK